MESEEKRQSRVMDILDHIVPPVIVLAAMVFGAFMGYSIANPKTITLDRNDYEKFRIQVMDNNGEIAELQHQLQYLQTRRQCDMNDVYIQIENLEKRVFSKPESAADFPECE